jgi:hypothetical protein
MTFNLDQHTIHLNEEKSGWRLTSSAGDHLLLAHVTMEETKELVTRNYQLVKQHYQEMGAHKVAAEDLATLSLKIVLHYFYMYQLWRSLYKKEKNRDLGFLTSDLQHPQTWDMVIAYFKTRSPKNYSEPCKTLLGLDTEKFIAYEKGRQAFYDHR